MRGAWDTAKPTRPDFAAAVTELNAVQLVGEGSVLARGPQVPVTHMEYFKPLDDGFLNEVRSKDRRSAK